jgi:hypothetical protein
MKETGGESGTNLGSASGNGSGLRRIGFKPYPKDSTPPIFRKNQSSESPISIG